MSIILQPRLAGILTLLLVVAPAREAACQEFVSRTLTDAIYKGDGVIDLLKDIGGGDLASYFDQNGGFLMLGADVNEDNSGNESSDSLGVAIKQAQLSISTTQGDFTFSDFFTSTSAMLRESGGTSTDEYYTLFGQAGSSQLTGTTGGIDLSAYDDVLWLENIEFSGEILSAQLRITLLDTPKAQSTEAESFFDYSGGFEDFALLSVADAILLEEAAIGTASAPSNLTYSSTATVAEALGDLATDPLAPPAAPTPPWIFAVALVGLAATGPRQLARHAR